MKKIKYIIMTLLIVCGLSACGTNSFNEQTNDTSLFGGHVYIYTDPDTNVDYMVFTSGYKGGICPRYNSDGTLYVEQDAE